MGDKSQGVNADLHKLENVSEREIMKRLGKLYNKKKYFCSAGSNALLYINPFCEDESFSYKTSRKYVNNYKHFSNENTPLPPNIYDLVNSAYSHMTRDKEDQSIIIR